MGCNVVDISPIKMVALAIKLPIYESLCNIHESYLMNAILRKLSYLSLYFCGLKPHGNREARTLF